jgi:hypothetical protein
MTFKSGDAVRLTYKGRTVDAVIALASPNGASLFVCWEDGLLGGHAGSMPIMRDHRSGDYFSLIEGDAVTLEKRP